MVIQVLESATDEELLTLLLQLVQALRYEPNLEGVAATMGTAPASDQPMEGATVEQINFEWCRTIVDASPLAGFLIRRASVSYNGIFIFLYVIYMHYIYIYIPVFLYAI